MVRTSRRSLTLLPLFVRPFFSVLILSLRGRREKTGDEEDEDEDEDEESSEEESEDEPALAAASAGQPAKQELTREERRAQKKQAKAKPAGTGDGSDDDDDDPLENNTNRAGVKSIKLSDVGAGQPSRREKYVPTPISHFMTSLFFSTSALLICVATFSFSSSCRYPFLVSFQIVHDSLSLSRQHVT
jgi:hypothetical protein